MLQIFLVPFQQTLEAMAKDGKQAKLIALELLEKIGLSDKAAAYPYQLSVDKDSA